MWTKESVWARMLEAESAVLRALVLLDNRQTPEERASRETIHLNGKGWNAWDARHDMPALAAKVRRQERLTDHEFYMARARLKKYAGQLAAILNARGVPQGTHTNSR